MCAIYTLAKSQNKHLLMFIESFTGVTEKMDVQIQKSCEAIQIITLTNAAVNTTSVSLKVVGKHGNKILYTDMPLLDLAEIMAADEGLYFKDLTNYAGQVPFAGTKSLIQIPVAFGGSYQLGNNEYFSLDFKNTVSGTTYRISALESLDLDGKLYDIDKKAVSAPRTNQRWSNSGANYIALPRTNFDKIQLFGFNQDGEPVDCTATFEELAGNAFYQNDLVAGVARTIATTPAVNVIDSLYGFDNLLIVNLENVREYEIFCTGAAGYTFYEVAFKS